MRSCAVAVRMLGAGVKARVAVVVSQVPRRTRLDGLTTASAVDSASSDDGHERLASASVERLPVLPVAQPKTDPASRSSSPTG